MELTLENLILFLKTKTTDELDISSQSVVREIEDGIGAIYLLDSISKKFNVTFKDFSFTEYFYGEDELLTLKWRTLLHFKNQRKIKNELTVQMLFGYMKPLSD